MILQHLHVHRPVSRNQHKVKTVDAQQVRAKLRRTPLGFKKEEEAHLKNKNF